MAVSPRGESICIRLSGSFSVKLLIGRKLGMSQIFDPSGEVTSVTVIEVGPLSPPPTGIEAGDEARAGSVARVNRASTVRVVLVRMIAPDKLGR